MHENTLVRKEIRQTLKKRYNVTRMIGSGVHSLVYGLKNDPTKVVKVTTSSAEAQLAYMLKSKKGRPFKATPKIYTIEQSIALDSDSMPIPYWIILEEKVKMLSGAHKTYWDVECYIDSYEVFLGEGFRKSEPSLKKFHNWLKKKRIVIDDIHNQNIGFRRLSNELVIFDFSCFHIPRKNFEPFKLVSKIK